MPEPVSYDVNQLAEINKSLQERSEKLEEEIRQFQHVLDEVKNREVSEKELKNRRKRSFAAAKNIKLSEAETRYLIDEQLKAAGWEADTANLRYSKGARPENGTCKAIAEWPTASGHADYALFVNHHLIGIVEAKRKEKDAVSDLLQAKRYAQDIEIKGDESFIGGPWEKFRVPFLFATNGRPYLKQLEHKSGIWFLDVRRPANHPRVLPAWHSPRGLLDLFRKDQDVSEIRLKKEPFDYLGLRDYQIKAIESIEHALEQNKRQILLAMATGTGKTRTAIGLIYRLIKAERFNRILFLVDRNALGEQAEDAFKEAVMEDLHTFNEIFDMQSMKTAVPEETTRVHISTVQGMIRRIMFPPDDKDFPTVDRYDCILVDEAHRGYTLDKELGEIELEFRDEADYISKYRMVLEYFDAVKIGLTATPAPHTAEIFGYPVFSYQYRDAVLDGWLIDHEPPHQIETRLARDGIKWKKGETVPVYDSATGTVTNLTDIPDDLCLEIDHFNKMVITEKFNETVAKVLVKELDPEGDEKTLIFAAGDDHADMIVRILKKKFAAVGMETHDEAIEKITGSIDKQLEMIKRFKNEKYPNIAVTVDLLTTGVDVPEICNIVFLRRVRSRILYEQMMGRATRLCERIKKSRFRIFDAVGLYAALEPVTNMKPVTPKPEITLRMLSDELADMQAKQAGETVQKRHMEQIVAKMLQKARQLDEDARKEFEKIAEGQTPESFIQAFRGKSIPEVREILKGKQHVLAFLNENRSRARKQFISHHDDELTSHTRGYGKGEKPEDYLNRPPAKLKNLTEKGIYDIYL
ncbi:MAG: type I restriction-modification system endonuclease [Desulfococcaceae bacterium]